jgi:hypothetical protein
MAWIDNVEPELEAELHSRWAEFNVAGEWFDVMGCADFISYLEEHAKFPEAEEND